ESIYKHRRIWLSAHDPKRISLESAIKTMNYFLKFLGKHCNNLTLLKFPFGMEYSKIIQFSQFITSFTLYQRKLKHIVLSGIMMPIRRRNGKSDYCNELNLLSSQSESLQILEFEYLSFCNIDKKDLNLLCSIKNIKELKFNGCKGLNRLDFWAKNLTKLKIFKMSDHQKNSKSFLTQLFQSSSN